MKFLPCNFDQAYLLPPSVKEVLGENHLCLFIHRTVEEFDPSGWKRVMGRKDGRRKHRRCC